MTTFFGAIADDFTGATDLAALLARSGIRVSLRIGVPQQMPGDSAPFEIVALKIRTAPVSEAVASARDALKWLKVAGAQRFYWKYCSTFDSTAKGNIGPVAEALMADLQVDRTIYCPAFPENGRRVFMGNLFVGEQPLAESAMKDHPLTPMRDSNLVRVLQPQVRRRVGLANLVDQAGGVDALRRKLTALAVMGIAHVVIDAVTDDDLGVIAGAVTGMRLLTGGSALATPLAASWIDSGQVERPGPSNERNRVDGGALVLSGSCSSMTNLQVARFVSLGHPSFRLDPLSLADSGSGPVIEWLDAQEGAATPIIYATADPASVRAVQERLGAGEAGELVERTLADCAVHSRDRGRGRLVIAGGETSGAVIRALAITKLEVGKEIAPGVPWCFAESEGRHVAVALKSGNFGDREFFSTALGALT